MTSGVQTKIDFKTVENYIKENGYKLYSGVKEYTNTKSKLLIECPKGHVVEMSFTTFKSGSRCKHCWKQRQKTTGFHKANLVLAKKVEKSY